MLLPLPSKVRLSPSTFFHAVENHFESAAVSALPDSLVLGVLGVALVLDVAA